MRAVRISVPIAALLAVSGVGAALLPACAERAARAPVQQARGVPAPAADGDPRTNTHSASAARVTDDRSEISGPPSAAQMEAGLAEFFGAGYPPAPDASPHGRVGSRTWGTWIQPAPRSGALPLGSIRDGSSLPLLSAERLPGQGKCAEFVSVELGVVCVGGRATLDMDSEWMRAGRWTTPAPGPVPYYYAMSVGAPMLTAPVPEAEFVWKIGTRDIAKMRGWNAGHDELAQDAPIVANGPVPDFLQRGGRTPMPWGPAKGIYKKMAPKGVMLAYTRAFEAHGRSWVLTTDMSVVPAEGLKRFAVSDFSGTELSDGVSLPIAYMRPGAQPKWRKTDSGFEKSSATWPHQGWVGLTGAMEKHAGKRFYETRDGGLYIEKSSARLIEKKKPPWEAKGKRWIHIRVNRGTLVLYDGAEPVFATLMSPGKEDATPYGRYWVESKHHVSTMTTESGDPKRSWIADVPWTTYFKRPYAIHAAYWHSDFGERKSGGCVNLSPLDAKRVFEWIEPELPVGWGSVQAYGMGAKTFVLVEG